MAKGNFRAGLDGGIKDDALGGAACMECELHFFHARGL